MTFKDAERLIELRKELERVDSFFPCDRKSRHFITKRVEKYFVKFRVSPIEQTEEKFPVKGEIVNNIIKQYRKDICRELEELGCTDFLT